MCELDLKVEMPQHWPKCALGTKACDGCGLWDEKES